LAGKLELREGKGEIVALITCPSAESADELASELVDKKVAACVNIIPGLTSVYRWKGEVCRDSELLLVVKTTEDSRSKVSEVVGDKHPYTEPELIFLPISSGSVTYLDWVVGQVS